LSHHDPGTTKENLALAEALNCLDTLRRDVAAWRGRIADSEA
jgi:hypothetical protein